MKVALLVPLPPPMGGIGTWALRLKEVMPKDCEVVFVNEGLVGGREFFGEKAKKNLFDEIRRCLRIWRDLKHTLEDKDVAVVHSNIPAVPGGMLRELMCAHIAHSRKCKFVIHYHSTVSSSVSSRLPDYLLRRLSDAADEIIVLNEKSRDFVAARSRTPIRLIPNFVSGNELVEHIEVRPTLANALYVGGVCEEKGIYDYLEVAKRFPDITFTAIGKIEEGVAEAAPSNVVLTGPQSHDAVHKALMKSDVFFFMSHYVHEGFSVALTEAMAAGLPCIVTDWAANKDMIGSDGGVVVPVGDVDAAASGLESMRIAEKRAAMSHRNIGKVRAAYSQDKVVPQYLAVYREVLGLAH